MKKRKIAIVGNPNSGKTTLFNRLAGTNYKVGNWPGVTVEKKEGSMEHRGVLSQLVDLPGKYSLSTSSLEEKIARDYIINEKPDVLLNVIDGTNLERNMYLTLQLIELEVPLIIAVNMVDEFDLRKVKLDFDRLSKDLGVKVIPISAAKGINIDELKDELQKDVDKVKPVMYSSDIEAMLSGVSRADTIAKLETDEETASLLTDERYRKIGEILDRSYDKGVDKYKFSDFLDSVLLNNFLGLPIFLGIMGAVFYLTFTVGNIFVDVLDVFFNETVAGGARNFLEFVGAHELLVDLVVDGIIGGVGGVLTFIPNIAILFLFITVLEDIGYMTRAAYIMDRGMEKIGLNGKHFIPMILGFGCNVPAILSTRTLENEKDRLLAILINPFMSCSARFPVYILFAGVFFKGYEALVVFSLYIFGILMAVLSAYIFRKVFFQGERTHLVLELPQYRRPSLKGVLLQVWERVRGYIVKAGTVIFAASVIIWVALNYNFTGQVDITESFGASIGKALAPIFSLSGFGTWESALSLISGIFAKEIVVSNTAIIYGLGDVASMSAVGEVLRTVFTPVSAYAFMVFVLLYTPCVAVIGVIKRETNSWGWTAFSVLYQFGVALVMSALVYQIGSLF